MIETTTLLETPVTSRALRDRAASVRRNFLLAAGLVIVSFGRVLSDLLLYGLKTDVHSHVLLIPVVSAYFVWIGREKLPMPQAHRSGIARLLFSMGLLALAAYFALAFGETKLSRNDRLTLTVLAFVLFFTGTVVRFLGVQFARSIAFPLAFLGFMAPLPDALTTLLETGSKNASAEAFAWMMSLSGASYFRDGLVFAMPGLTIEVAQECSGIRSSLMLFITSLIAGQMFPSSAKHKAILALAVFPLGIARNAFRIYTLSMLSIHWNPKVIDSALHHKGGPIFFALSLAPFFLLLFWLLRSESRRRAAAGE